MFTVKKIAIVSSFFPPSSDTAADYSYYLAKELTDVGIKVKVITSWKNEACGTKSMAGFSVACIPSKKVLGRFFFVSRKYFKNIQTETAEFKPDCVVVNDYVRRMSLFGAKAALALQIPCLAVNHLFGPLTHKNKLIGRVAEKYEEKMLKLFKKNRVTFAGAGYPQTEHLKKMGAVPRYEIPYGVKTDVIPLPAAKKKMGIKEDTILCVMDGADREDVIKTADMLDGIRKHVGPEIILAAIGKKPKKWPDGKERVTFTGDIPWEEELSLKYGCDIYIHYVKRDRLDCALMEAGLMSRAALCILPDREYEFTVARDMISTLVVYDEEDAIKAAMQKLRVHKKLRAQLGEAFKSEVELKYGWNQSALALIDAVWELNGGHRRHSK